MDFDIPASRANAAVEPHFFVNAFSRSVKGDDFLLSQFIAISTLMGGAAVITDFVLDICRWMNHDDPRIIPTERYWVLRQYAAENGDPKIVRKVLQDDVVTCERLLKMMRDRDGKKDGQKAEGEREG